MKKNIFLNSVLVYVVSVFYLIIMWLTTRNLLQPEDGSGLIGVAPFFYILITIIAALAALIIDEPVGVNFQGAICMIALIGVFFSLFYDLSLIWIMLAFLVGSFLLFCWGEMMRGKKGSSLSTE